MDDNNNPNNFGSFDDNNNQGNFDTFNSNNTQDNFGSFDANNSGIFEPVNNTANPYELFNDNMPYEQNNNIDSNAQYEQPNDLSNNMPYSLDNNFDSTASYDQNNMQYNQANSFDGNMQYTQDNSFDNGMQYTQGNNFGNGMQYGQANNNVNSYQSFENANVQYNQASNFDNGMNNGYGYSVSSDYAADFERAWMGNIYDKAHSKKFNWCSALFNGVYFMYRKMYVSGLLFVILFNLTMLIPSLMFFGGILKSVALYTVLAIILPLIFMILFGFIFYPLYKSFVSKKFNSLKATITDNSALINEANTKGGTSVLGVVIALIVSAIITSVGLGTTISNSIEQLFNKLPDQEQGGLINETTEPVTDMKSFNFLNEYSIQYDSLSWFFNPGDNSLTKGNYTLIYSGQYLDDIKNNFNVDVTNSSGRASLLNTIVSNLESQAVAINLSLEVATNSFAAGNDSYYAYLDIISDTDISRYYLLLLPEKDILFQFILSSNDTNIDYATNLEVINILTSISAEESNEPNNENSNTISNEISNQLSNTISSEVPSGLISNEIDSNVVNTINSNEIVGGNTLNNLNENTSISNDNQVPLQSLLN